MRPSSASPGWGDAIKRSQMTDTLASAAKAQPHRLASSHAKPNLVGCVPHSQPRVWMLTARPDTAPRPHESLEDARADAIKTLSRGVGIVYQHEVEWHARPARSQIFFA